jgi:hypothetical protein
MKNKSIIFSKCFAYKNVADLEDIKHIASEMLIISSVIAP